MATVTAVLKKYNVQLDEFHYTAHVDGKGKRHLFPQKNSRPVRSVAYVVEARNERDAQGEFMTAMGITKTIRDFHVKEVKPDAPKGSTADANDDTERTKKKKARAKKKKGRQD